MSNVLLCARYVVSLTPDAHRFSCNLLLQYNIHSYIMLWIHLFFCLLMINISFRFKLIFFPCARAECNMDKHMDCGTMILDGVDVERDHFVRRPSNIINSANNGNKLSWIHWINSWATGTYIDIGAATSTWMTYIFIFLSFPFLLALNAVALIIMDGDGSRLEKTTTTSYLINYFWTILMCDKRASLDVE